MDDKVLDSIGNVELADQAIGAILSPDVGGGNMTRDEGEMAFHGKKAQFKVRVLSGLAAEISRDYWNAAEIRVSIYHRIHLQSSGDLGSNVCVSSETDPL